MSDAEARATAFDWLWDQLDAAFTADELESPAADEPPGVLRVYEPLRRATVLWRNRAAATDAEIDDVRRLIDSAADALPEASGLCGFLAALCEVIARSPDEPSPPAAASDAPWFHFSHGVRARLYRASPDIAAMVARCDACLNLYVASLTRAIPAVSAALSRGMPRPGARSC